MEMTALNRRMLLVVNDDDLVANAKRRLQQKVDVASFLRLPHQAQMVGMSRWPFLEVLGLYRYSTEGRVVAAELMRRRLLTCLGRLCDNPAVLRDRMRECSAVLAGSACVSLLCPGESWSPENLDVYCPTHTWDDFCDFLVDTLGGQVVFEDRRKQDEDPDDIRPGSDARKTIKVRGVTVDVHRSGSPSALSAVARAESTLMLSMFHADGCCVAYPWLLDARTTVLNPRGHTHLHVEKYTERGFMVNEYFGDYWSDECSVSCAPYGQCAGDIRFFGDAHCATIRFDDGVLAGQPMGRVDMLSAMWAWGGQGCGNVNCISVETSGVLVVVILAHPVNVL